MHHFFADKTDFKDGAVYLGGADYNHAVNVLRLRQSERVMISDPDGRDYYCTVDTVEENDGASLLRLIIEEQAEDNHELPSQVILFQCMPKSDKMELIIQKATELGVSMIVPVTSKNCVVKLDDKKTESRLKRWRAIAESAAKQSKRSIIPEIHEPVDFKKACEMMETLDVRIMPYENENGMVSACEAIISFLPGKRIGVMLGPEGGFDRMEASMAGRHGISTISLGKRILRAETAAIAILSLIMIRLEISTNIDLAAE